MFIRLNNGGGVFAPRTMGVCVGGGGGGGGRGPGEGEYVPSRSQSISNTFPSKKLSESQMVEP